METEPIIDYKEEAIEFVPVLWWGLWLIFFCDLAFKRCDLPAISLAIAVSGHFVFHLRKWWTH